MTSINLNGATVSFPFYGVWNRSFKQRFVQALTGEGLQDQQGDKQLIEAISDITMQLAPGDKLAILGDNGVGKTTLLRVMSGLLKPSSGIAHIDGTPMAILDIGFGFDPSMTLSHTITAYGLLRGKTLSETCRTENAILDYFSLSPFANRQIRILPPGCLFRLCTGLAFFYDANIILFDEVFDAAGPETLEKIKNYIAREFPADGIIAVAERSRAILTGLCNKALVLEDGRLMDIGEFDAIMAKHGDKYTL